MRPVLAAALLAWTAAPWAAPNEIKVFTDELAGYGEHTLETHVNKASRAGPGAAGARTPLQVMPEYSYGIWRNWELSLQLPAAFSGGASRLEGYRAELQYVAPHDEDLGFYWGANFELARSERWDERRFWNAELVPILGYRTGRWHLVANPELDKALRGERGRVSFQPSVKAAYRTSGKNYLGVEYYEMEERSRMLYFAWDGKVGKSDINVGLGRGLTDSADRWVLKMIYEFAF